MMVTLTPKEDENSECKIKSKQVTLVDKLLIQIIIDKHDLFERFASVVYRTR